jgi:hypothetical protein
LTPSFQQSNSNLSTCTSSIYSFLFFLYTCYYSGCFKPPVSVTLYQLWPWSNSYISFETMFSCSSLYYHQQHRSIYFYWCFSWSFQKLFCSPSSQKKNMDKEDLSSYRPISHRSFLSKLTKEWSNFVSLTIYLAITYSIHSNQPVSSIILLKLLTWNYSTITSSRHQQVTCLTLLDLSAACDTIDHSILLERVSFSFGITSTALFWIKSYLLNLSFYVSIGNSVSSVHQLLYGVPRGSVLGPLLFILYTTTLSTVISNSSVNHHLYADDTRLFLSFSAASFSHNITHLQTAISKVSNWMPSSNFLSLNPSKTEFLVIGLPSQQLSKLSFPTIHLPNNITLSPVDSAALQFFRTVINLHL